MTREDVCNIVRTRLDAAPEVQVCLLYGSAAADTMCANSDVDIAICGDRQFPAEYLVDLQLSLAKDLGREVDLIDLPRINGLILTKVITKGIKIINKKPELLAYHMKRMLFYNADMLPNYKMMQMAKLKRFAYGS